MSTADRRDLNPASSGMALPSSQGVYFFDLETGQVTSGLRFAGISTPISPSPRVISPDSSDRLTKGHVRGAQMAQTRVPARTWSLEIRNRSWNAELAR
jgi:hypothetical protein